MMVKRMGTNKTVLSLMVTLDTLEEEYNVLCSKLSALKAQNTDPNAEEYRKLNEQLTKLKAETAAVCAKLNKLKD